MDYLRQIEDMFSQGVGLFLWGPNGQGKTSLAAIVAKEYRRRFKTVLFVEAAALKEFVALNESFDEDETYWQRAMSVDVLILDDLGKGVGDNAEFGERLIDSLIRVRNANQLVTIITTNAVLHGRGESIDEVLKDSTRHVLKEHTLAVYVEGEDQRRSVKEAIERSVGW
jgi:DNA replication protein DnaC